VSAWRTLNGAPPRIIAHRGASGVMPEHTLPGYRLAIEQGADVIEPDLVPTRDGILITRHERDLARSTDVAARTDWRGDGPQWFADDFDFARLAGLRALQPFPARSRAHDGAYPIPRFADVLDLATETWRSGRMLGVYPEIKHPLELMARGIDSTALLMAQLCGRDLVGAGSPVWVQCFELEPLRRVHEVCGNPVFALFDRLDAAALVGLRVVAPWLSGVALSKAALIGTDGDASLAARAHDIGWQVHVWTLRDDAVMAGFNDVGAEYRALFAAGVDALFCDFPDSGIRARRQWPMQA
jgi:glycerophosphoryl diester phosphodiesterase